MTKETNNGTEERKDQASPKQIHDSMPKAKPRVDLTGFVNRKLTVIGNPRRNTLASNNPIYWECVCECGSRCFVRGSHLTDKQRSTISCGCAKKTRNGLTATEKSMYQVWRGMHARCNNRDSVSYKFYGAKGVTICKRWYVFERFVEDMVERPEGKTLDRYRADWSVGDSPLSYCKKNCRWATLPEQHRNKTTNVFIEHQGMNLTLAEWGRKTGIGASAIRKRVLSGWPVEQALTIPSFVGKNSR